MTRSLLLAIMTLLLAPTICNASDIPLKKDMPFTEARKALLKHHWKPQKTKRQTEHFAVDKILLKKKIIEVDICTVDSFCIFNYKKNNECLKVVAHGENLNDLTITNWDSSCPDEQ